MIRRLIGLIGLLAALLCPFQAASQYVTLVGNLQGANGLPSSNYTISFVPSQWFYIAGTGVVVNTTSYCGTSTDGSFVGVVNPLVATVNTPVYTGTLPAGNYYSVYTFYTSSGAQTLPSPETVAQLTSTGQLQIAPPTSGIPAGVVGMDVYIGTTSGGETYQGQTVGNTVYTQSVPLVTGAGLPTSNNTICKQVANDAGWPTGTGYVVGLTDPAGNTLPGYPMMWQLLGPNTTVNVSNGLPYYHGVVTYPVPILATPQNHAAQSISGPLSLTGYNLVNVGALSVGTGLPAWGVDVEGSGNNALINAKGGYLVNGDGGTSGNCLGSDGIAYDGPIACFSGDLYYQTFSLSTHAADAIAQEPYIVVGTGTGLTAASFPPIGTDVGRTVLQVNASNTILENDPYVVMTSLPAGGGANTCAIWDASGGITGLSTCSFAFTGTSGYQIEPSGLIFEFGLSFNAGTGDNPVTFPLPFPHAIFSITQMAQNAIMSGGRDPCYISAGPTTTGVTLSTGGSTNSCYWIAVGY